MQKKSNFLLSTDGLVLATWLLMSLVFGISIATGHYTFIEQITFLLITVGFGSFLMYALVFSRSKTMPLQRQMAKSEEQKN